MSAQASSATAAPAHAARSRSSLLRVALKLDAWVTGANGVAYLVAAEPLGDLLGLSPSQLRAAGAFLVVFGALVGMTAARAAISAMVYVIVAANVVWALGSVIAAIMQWGSPETVGTIWIVLQAVVVAGFAGLQIAGLRRS